jgi:hypothetical protein
MVWRLTSQVYSNSFEFILSSILLYLLKVSRLLFQTIEALLTVPAPELSLRLYLQCAEVHGIVWFINI